MLAVLVFILCPGLQRIICASRSSACRFEKEARVLPHRSKEGRMGSYGMYYTGGEREGSNGAP